MFILHPDYKDIAAKINEIRKFETKDIVKRLKVISSEDVKVKNFPEKTPKAIFNPALKVEEDGLVLYGRICVGYYTYTSSIIELKVPFDDLYSDEKKIYEGDIIIYPSNKFDLWGVEDPRYSVVRSKEFITYCGRTVNYFQTHIRVERTLPVCAAKTPNGWQKVAVFRMPEGIREFVVSDKNAFLFYGEELMLFHRLHMLNEKFYLNICKVPSDILYHTEMHEIKVGRTLITLEPAEFEKKIGWCTPPIKVNDEDEYLVLLHGVDKELTVYRVFAALIDKKANFTAITPYYIMEPKELFEIYGDRPYVTFPCGAQIYDGKLYIAYGGGDSVIGIGEADLQTLLDVLYENRI